MVKIGRIDQCRDGFDQDGEVAPGRKLDAQFGKPDPYRLVWGTVVLHPAPRRVTGERIRRQQEQPAHAA